MVLDVVVEADVVDVVVDSILDEEVESVKAFLVGEIVVGIVDSCSSLIPAHVFW